MQDQHRPYIPNNNLLKPRAETSCAAALFLRLWHHPHGSGRTLQLSSNFVFNAQQSTPSQHSQPVDPLGVYGASKADGGLAVLRTSWVYGPVGRNFLLTMLRLLSGARTRRGRRTPLE
jgi:hypothetical protein